MGREVGDAWVWGIDAERVSGPGPAGDPRGGHGTATGHGTPISAVMASGALRGRAGMYVCMFLYTEADALPNAFSAGTQA